MTQVSISQETATPSSPILITDPVRLAEMTAALSVQPLVAVDTESNSLYVYQERVCLLQFSIPGADYLVDPLSGLDLSPLARIFADPAICKIFHAAEYDVICLKRDFGFSLTHLFDTMWAARILGWPRVGLGDVLNEYFGVHTNKHYQRYNWGERPLKPEALAYACLDTRYLLPLRALQAELLTRKGRWEEAQEMFDQIAAIAPPANSFDTEHFWCVKGARDLSPREQAILRELYIWRDQQARCLNRPPFKVLGDCTLVELARAYPGANRDLLRVNGLKSHHIHRYGKQIMRAIDRGLQAPLPKPPPLPPRHSDAEIARFQALREWRKQVAARRGVDPDVVISNAVLWTLAEQNPRTEGDLSRIEGLGPWKRKTYGADILRVLRSQKDPKGFRNL